MIVKVGHFELITNDREKTVDFRVDAVFLATSTNKQFFEENEKAIAACEEWINNGYAISYAPGIYVSR